MYTATQENIDSWKRKYGSIFKIAVGEGDDQKCCYLKAPSRKDLSYATTGGKDDSLKFNEILLKNCWIAGDEEIKTKDEYFLGASAQLGGIIEVKKSSLEKL